MARKSGRYTQARLYMVGGALAAMMMAWMALAVRDSAPASPAAVSPATATSDTVTGTPQTAPQRRSSAKVAPHTRTRAS